MPIKLLYHGSNYFHTELKPGFMHSGTEVFWDETESNRYLYATTVKDSAIELGFASAVEKNFLLERFQSDNGKIILTLSDKRLPVITDLKRLQVFVYEIYFSHNAGWQKVNNKINNMDTEYKTDRVVAESMIAKIERVDLGAWLGNKQVAIIPYKPSYAKW